MNRNIVLAGGLLLSLLLLPPLPGGIEEFDLDIAPDQALILQATYDPKERVVYVATAGSIYRFRRGDKPQAERIVQRKGEERLALALGGAFYALLQPSKPSGGLFSASLKRIEDPSVSIDLAAATSVSSLILGGRDKLLVAKTPLGSPEDFEPRHLYVFYEANGAALERREMSGPHQWVLDPAGDAIVFLGSSGAEAYSRAGKKLWAAEGSFRGAAIGPGGGTAVLNRAEPAKLSELLVRRAGGELEVVRLDRPIAKVRIAGDETFALAVLADASYVVLDLKTLTPSLPRRLPLEDVLRVSDVEIIDSDTLAFGVKHGTLEDPSSEGTIVILRKEAQGEAVLTRRLSLRARRGSIPALDATPGTRAFIARTDLRSTFIDLGN
jgi:hypothetical protein